VGTFRTFDHTADLGLEVRADSLEDLLATAARAVFEQVIEDGPTDVASAEEVRAAAAPAEGEDFAAAAAPGGRDCAELLVVWLQELLYRFETRRLVPLQVDVREARPGAVRAAVRFGRFDPARHVARHEVKAVTYHELCVRRDPDGAWTARLILDV